MTFMVINVFLILFIRMQKELNFHDYILYINLFLQYDSEN